MPLTATDKVLISGAGQAGAQAAFSLRQLGFCGAITLIGEEAAPLYQRPPLSKAYLKGEMEAGRLYLRPLASYAELNVELVLGTRVEGIDRSARWVALSTGESLPYDALILATGSRPRALPPQWAVFESVQSLRGLQDVDALKPRMQAGQRLVIIGAGYIGLEAAAVARALGLEVCVLEAAPRVLARVTGPVISAFFEAEHRAHGVDIRTGVAIDRLEGQDGQVSAVVLTGGERIPADTVLCGIGILPNQELAAEAGIACSNGILVDRQTRTNDPRVLAIGDCAVRPLSLYGRAGRLESVHNAIEQGKIAAASLMGAPAVVEDCPWFWSDQYDLKLQIAGLSQGYDQAVVRGDISSRKFCVFYLRHGVLIAADAINSAPEFLMAKKLILAGARLAPASLCDTSLNIRDIAAMPA